MKLSSLYSLSFLLLTLFLTACQQPLVKPDATESAPSDAISPVVDPPAVDSGITAPAELTSDIIYHYLAAEISIQRQQFDAAYDHFIFVASRIHDQSAAEKAARLALLLKQDDKALYASSMWVEYEPDSIQARQLIAVLHLRNDDLSAAAEQFHVLLEIAENENSNGFLRIASLLAGEEDKQQNLVLMRLLTRDYSQSAQAKYAMALVEFEAKRYPQALKSITSAKTLEPLWDRPYVLEAQILSNQGNNQAAEENLRQAVTKLPEKKILQQAYGRILVENQQYSKAIKAFTKAYELEPSDLDALYAVSMLAMQAEDWETARNSWKTLLLSDDSEKRDDANYFLGQIEEMDGNPDLAMKHYMAVGEGSSYTESRLRLARLVAKTGQLSRAQAIYTELRVLQSQHAMQIYVAEAQTLDELGLTKQALGVYTTAVDSYPDNIDLRYTRGLYAADNGNLELAIDDFEIILISEPDNADALNALGYTLADQTDRYQEALVYITKAHKLQPDSPAILDSLGWVLYRLGNYQEALKYLHKAAVANPDSEIAAHLGEVLWKLGNHSEAKEVWNKALISEPDSKKLKEVMQRLQ